MHDRQVTWPSFFDGGTRGPIITRLGIRAFPTIYVLDKKGVVRHILRDVNPRAHVEEVLKVCRTLNGHAN